MYLLVLYFDGLKVTKLNSHHIRQINNRKNNTIVTILRDV